MRGPVRERLVEGAKQRYQNGCAALASGDALARYFRLLDALEALVAAEPPPPPPGEEAAAT